MKKIFMSFVFVFVLLFSGLAMADTQVTLIWDANPTSDQALGYKVYDNLVEIDDVVNTGSVVIVPDGNHSFTVTCYNVNGPSIHSTSVDRVYFTAAPGQPSNFLATDEVKIQ